jgi:EmrB/QacA subfamily drug resistance transporter
VKTYDLASLRGWLVLLICCSSLFIVSLDNTVLQIALPTIQDDLGASLSQLQWTIDAYTLVLASFLLLAGSMADRFGRRKVFVIGLIVFTLGSLLCSLATSVPALIGFRIVQALGGSMLNPVALSIITHTFTDTRDRARAIGVWGAVVGLAMAAGPLVGGLLVQAVGWQAIFWMNVPVGIAAIILTLWFVPESRAETPRRVDLLGQFLAIVTLATLIAAIIEAPGLGWDSPVVLGFAAVAVIAGVALVCYELRRREPLIEVRFFRSAPFTGAAINALASFGTLGGFLMLTTLYLQTVAGKTALEAGLWMLPMAVMVLVSAPLAGRMVGSIGPRLPLLIGGGAILITGVLFGPLHGQGHPVTLVIGAAVFGVGFGFDNAPITTVAVSGIPNSQAGVASALASTFRQTGAALGIAVIGSILATGLETRPFLDAAAPAWLVIAGSGLTVLIVAILTTRGTHAQDQPSEPRGGEHEGTMSPTNPPGV